MPGPVGPPAPQHRRVMDDYELAEAFDLRRVEGGAQGGEVALADASARDDRPGQPAHRVDRDERRLSDDADAQGAREVGVLLLGKVFLEEAGRGAFPRIAVVVSGEGGEAGRV